MISSLPQIEFREISNRFNSVLILKSGKIFFGHGIGAVGITFGEICFNTGMTGYQETLTDPSYAGQIINFTFPHIGNVGANTQDYETEVPYVNGLIICNPISKPSNFRSEYHFNDWLKKHNITGISGIDTREITKYIRQNGSQNVAIIHSEQLLEEDIQKTYDELTKLPEMVGSELSSQVSTDKIYYWNQGLLNNEKIALDNQDHIKIVVIDFGIKQNILRCLKSFGAKIVVVPATTDITQILTLEPHGIFLSNGPGDPAETAKYAQNVIAGIIASDIPLFAICMGHQLVAHAIGAKTYHLSQGHRGANHPVKNLMTGQVEITSQNHGFAVYESTLPANAIVTHRSLFDNTIEGLKLIDKPVFTVQYHPESSPGPHDSRYLFIQFFDYINDFIQNSGQ
ncbi:glutamine-hydrolyzing carbamoyl-phosphate synthase small subunit [Rickettsiales endosymbiont of Stachyamoeba lipophora]|uniref:glutamine-hydrolyzing carbamoyl-phosphate synthase small subunit n=1 Tax=Rickettsiales endosymbiont of Stachyamoeba lipophora TaxID=2486578 RepID=UPI000F649845|nr:glutamine-hydrolyzing carbamoyl-phosphate synthase small subunit [Rickettsiales endosymbiont of Stachyamoeba lipophora]AZL16285.1 carbamoyl-phosphate synthase small subunit [Rickettsiales endosymbiont of Stachyamoeba lipophora]